MVHEANATSEKPKEYLFPSKIILDEVAIPPAAVSLNLFTRLQTRAFSHVVKPCLVSDFAALTAKPENKKAFQRQQRQLGFPGCLVDMKLTCTIALQTAYHCRMNKIYLHGCRVNCSLCTRLPGKELLIYPAAVYNQPYSSGRRISSLGLFYNLNTDLPAAFQKNLG